MRRVAVGLGMLIGAGAALLAMAGMLTLLAIMPIVIFVGLIVVYAVLSSDERRTQVRTAGARVIEWPRQQTTASSSDGKDES